MPAAEINYKVYKYLKLKTLLKLKLVDRINYECVNYYIYNSKYFVSTVINEAINFLATNMEQSMLEKYKTAIAILSACNTNQGKCCICDLCDGCAKCFPAVKKHLKTCCNLEQKMLVLYQLGVNFSDHDISFRLALLWCCSRQSRICGEVPELRYFITGRILQYCIVLFKINSLLANFNYDKFCFDNIFATILAKMTNDNERRIGAFNVIIKQTVHSMASVNNVTDQIKNYRELTIMGAYGNDFAHLISTQDEKIVTANSYRKLYYQLLGID